MFQWELTDPECKFGKEKKVTSFKGDIIHGNNYNITDD